MEAVSLGVEDVSERLYGGKCYLHLRLDLALLIEFYRTAGVYDMPRRLDAFIERYEEDRVDDGPHRSTLCSS